MSAESHHLPGPTEFRGLFSELLAPEHRFYKLVLIYSFAISLLTLAVPISVQSLIDTIANIGLVRAVVMISLILFGLLLFSGMLYALRAYVMELFNRQIFIRLSSEMAMCAISARESGMDDRKRLALFNRFFDIMTLKKNIPNILTNGFTLVLTALIGFIVVSLYHLYFFLFAVILIALIWVVWKIWGWKAIVSAFALSEAKYETADALHDLSISLRDIKSTGNVEYILDEFNQVVNDHVDKQEIHFSYNYKQLLSLLLINALASAALLGMGGWLVIQGQLTLGQLVAAELIMMGIFAGLAPLAGYLGYFYDICAAVEEISRFNTLPRESEYNGSPARPTDHNPGLTFSEASFGPMESSKDMPLNFSLLPGDIICSPDAPSRIRNLVKNAVTANIFPARGEVYLGNMASHEMNTFALRKLVKVIDRASVIPGTIRHYLLFSNPAAMKADIQEALELTDLTSTIDNLPQGLETMLSADGWPLGLEQSLRLKLAAAFLSQPGILVLDHVVDLVDENVMEYILTRFNALNTSVLYFTYRTNLDSFTGTLPFDTDQTTTETTQS